MNHDLLRELAEPYVLGTLAEEERLALEAHVTTCQSCAATVRGLLRVIDGLGRAVDQRDPPAHLRERVLSAAKAGARMGAASEPVSGDPQLAYSFLLAAEGWKRHAVPGVSYKELAVERSAGQATLLITLDAGTSFPRHHHTGSEQCFVLAGDVRTGGRLLGPGDFHRAEAGSDHDEAYSEHGCTLMLIVSADDYVGLA